MNKLSLALASIPFLVFVACGADVTTATGGSGGNGGGGGGTSSSTGPGGAPPCPTNPPAVGAPCAFAQQTCSYGDGCCPLTFQCDASGWQELPTGCFDPPISCPADPPTVGQPCDTCFEPGPCAYDCPGTSAQTSATCVGGAWSFDGTCPVPPPASCGMSTCQPGEVCVETGGGAGISYTCAPDPCFPAPLSCACAQSLCGGPPYVCGGAMDQMVVCACPMCP